MTDEAWSTNHDLCRVPVAGGTPEKLTAGNQAADSCPRFSPDGKWLAYRAQAKPGYEADRWQLLIVPAGGGKPRSLTSTLDRSIDSFLWGADSQTIYCTSERNGGSPICKLSLKDGSLTELVTGGSYSSLSVSGDGKQLAASHATISAAGRNHAGGRCQRQDTQSDGGQHRPAGRDHDEPGPRA